MIYSFSHYIYYKLRCIPYIPATLMSILDPLPSNCFTSPVPVLTAMTLALVQSNKHEQEFF